MKALVLPPALFQVRLDPKVLHMNFVFPCLTAGVI